MDNSSLSSNNMIIIFEWLPPIELLGWQRLCGEFFDKIVPSVMWRMRMFPYVGNTMVHYFKPLTRDVKFYNILKNTQSEFQADREIPFGFRTMTIDKKSIFLIGGSIKWKC